MYKNLKCLQEHYIVQSFYININQHSGYVSGVHSSEIY